MRLDIISILSAVLILLSGAAAHSAQDLSFAGKLSADPF